MRVLAGMLVLGFGLLAQPHPAWSACGQVVEIPSHGGTTTRYALAGSTGDSATVSLVLLAGGGGHLDLDAKGCPHALTNNSLVRMAPLFHRAGFVTALVDAPSGMGGPDGLMGFRASSSHADDLGRVILDLRRRTGGAVWLVGTSRGSISAANAAARLSGNAAADGLIMTSVLMDGDPMARKSWVAQSVFNLPLDSITMPVLLIGHDDDNCIRSPSDMMTEVAARLRSSRVKVVAVTGGPGGSHPSQDVEACVALSPHGFIGQENEVVAEIRGFIGLGR
jgi:pimeloyl-ACP methyl ester carboxylesterase